MSAAAPQTGDDVRELLNGKGLGQYAERLIAVGYDTIERLQLTVDDDDELKRCGVELPGHRMHIKQLFMAAAESTVTLPSSPAPPPPVPEPSTIVPAAAEAVESGPHVFLSHTGVDKPFAVHLRRALEDRGIGVWMDCRELAPGDPLRADIRKAIKTANRFVVVIGPQTMNLRWVQWEVEEAKRVQKERGNSSDYRIVPLMLPGVEPTSLELWFGSEVLGIPVPSADLIGVQQVLPRLMPGLGLELPTDWKPSVEKAARPFTDLVLKLSHFRMEIQGDNNSSRRATAEAELVYQPLSGRSVSSSRFKVTAPLGPIEAGDLQWYLERYWRWPVGFFKELASAVEGKLSEWGQSLYKTSIEAACGSNGGKLAVYRWREDAVLSQMSGERRFSVMVDEQLSETAASSSSTAASRDVSEAQEAATLFLSLPWELVHDGTDFLFQGQCSARVRRQLRNETTAEAIVTSAPLRILLICARPEDEKASYIDHRASALPLVEALAPLGSLVKLTLLHPPTFSAMCTELDRAATDKEPYHVVHFDGHGVFDHSRRGDGAGGRLGLGALAFEDPQDVGKASERRTDIRDAKEIAAVIRKHRIPLFFLEACQSAHAELDVTSSVAGKLLEGGVSSVVAMSHSVLVETARRFVAIFYKSLLSGERIGHAMLEAQQALKNETFRGTTFTGDLHLQDWFVPVLFQEEEDPQLIKKVPSEEMQAEIAKVRELKLGALPKPPIHAFVGRSRQVLMAERLLCTQEPYSSRYVVFRGSGGDGKTTLACELARWLVASHRFERAAFVSVETSDDAKKIRWALGSQLVAGFESQAGQESGKDMQLLERALNDQSTLIVVDNMESILPPEQPSSLPSTAGSAGSSSSNASGSFDQDRLDAVMDLCETLSKIGKTRLVFTSRSALSPSFERKDCVVDVGRLSPTEAVELVGKVLKVNGCSLAGSSEDTSGKASPIEELVEAVGCHARSLVLIAPELGREGVRQTAETLRSIMAKLDRECPDDRERSLLASVELSLRRLPDAMRCKLAPLCVFHGGGHLSVIAFVVGLDVGKDEEVAVAKALVKVGLAELLSYGYLRLDPALALALRRGLSQTAIDAAEEKWAMGMAQFTQFLYEQKFKDAQRASTLASLDLANLLAALAWLNTGAEKGRSGVSCELVVDMATSLEQLLERLGQGRALQLVVSIRDAAAGKIGAWGNAQFSATMGKVDRLLDEGRMPDALREAQSLLQKSKDAVGTYAESEYNFAVAHLLLGRSLKAAGDAQHALDLYAEAELQFGVLAARGNKNAERMQSVCMTDRADCLMSLGRFDEAVKVYEASIAKDLERGDRRDVATGKFQLATAFRNQERYDKAMAGYEEAMEIFKALGEPSSIANVWHGMAMVHRQTGNFEAAEKAYQESLRIKVQLGDRRGEAAAHNELGNLYAAMGQLENAVRLHRQAVDIYSSPDIQDEYMEGASCSNAAEKLFRLKRYEESRTEIVRAIECSKRFGHAAEMWKPYQILSNIERACGNTAAAAKARQEALDTYLAYRRDGGQGTAAVAQICAALAQAVKEGKQVEVSAMLEQLTKAPEVPAPLQSAARAVMAIVGGSRDRTLLDDPAIHGDDSAEISLLLETLGGSSSGSSSNTSS